MLSKNKQEEIKRIVKAAGKKILRYHRIGHREIKELLNGGTPSTQRLGVRVDGCTNNI